MRQWEMFMEQRADESPSFPSDRLKTSKIQDDRAYSVHQNNQHIPIKAGNFGSSAAPVKIDASGGAYTIDLAGWGLQKDGNPQLEITGLGNDDTILFNGRPIAIKVVTIDDKLHLRVAEVVGEDAAPLVEKTTGTAALLTVMKDLSFDQAFRAATWKKLIEAAQNELTKNGAPSSEQIEALSHDKAFQARLLTQALDRAKEMSLFDALEAAAKETDFSSVMATVARERSDSPSQQDIAVPEQMLEQAKAIKLGGLQQSIGSSLWPRGDAEVTSAPVDKFMNLRKLADVAIQSHGGGSDASAPSTADLGSMVKDIAEQMRADIADRNKPQELMLPTGSLPLAGEPPFFDASLAGRLENLPSDRLGEPLGTLYGDLVEQFASRAPGAGHAIELRRDDHSIIVAPDGSVIKTDKPVSAQLGGTAPSASGPSGAPADHGLDRSIVTDSAPAESRLVGQSSAPADEMAAAV
jgi:hypothetical protein